MTEVDVHERILTATATPEQAGAQPGFRYWLPGREPLLWPGNNASAAEKQAWRERCQAHANGLLKLPESA